MKTQEIELIKGTFSPQEAKEILYTIIEDKIRFHNVKIIRGFETGTDTNASKQRIIELNASRSEANRMVENATRSGSNLSIHATICLTETMAHTKENVAG
jgi:hypothetical protein